MVQLGSGSQSFRPFPEGRDVRARKAQWQYSWRERQAQAKVIVNHQHLRGGYMSSCTFPKVTQ